MQTSDSIVIIPTYNEKENIENIIRAVFGLEKTFHILVIEDNSPDGTADIVRRLQKDFPERLFMIERKGKLGLGTAYITGFITPMTCQDFTRLAMKRELMYPSVHAT